MSTLELSTPATDPATAVRRLTAFKPTGRLHLGNYLGAIRPMLEAGADAARTEPIIMIANLHAMTVEHDPRRLRELTTEVLGTLLACGFEPDSTLIYVQSDVPEHAQLHYLLECTTGFGEAARMIQFKQKAATPDSVRLSLLTYPVLMAADILLHDADEVPVGDDQTQHLELARDVANRFNTRYGRTFTVPKGVNPAIGARVMDLADPTGKMGKTSSVDNGLVHLLDAPELVRRKVSRAMTDGDSRVVYDPYRKPGVANLLEILAACERSTPAQVAPRYASYAELKEATAEAIVDTLAPVQRRYREYVADAALLEEIRRSGAQRARERARHTVARATRAIGLTP